MTDTMKNRIFLLSFIPLLCSGWTTSSSRSGLQIRTAFAVYDVRLQLSQVNTAVVMNAKMPSEMGDDIAENGEMDVPVAASGDEEENPCWQDVYGVDEDCGMDKVYSANFVASKWIKGMPCAAGIEDCDMPEDLKRPGFHDDKAGIEHVDVVDFLHLKRAPDITKKSTTSSSDEEDSSSNKIMPGEMNEVSDGGEMDAPAVAAADEEDPCWQNVYGVDEDCGMDKVYSANFVASKWIKGMPCAAGIEDCDMPEDLKRPGFHDDKAGIEHVDVVDFLHLKRAPAIAKTSTEDSSNKDDE